MNRQPQQMRPLGYQPSPASAAAAGVAGRGRGVSLGSGRLGDGWPPGMPNPASRPGSGLTFSQSVLASQSNTPLDMNEFPALGNGQQTPNSQPWNRISTQSPSQNRPLQQQDLFSMGLEDFRIGTQGAQGMGQSQQSALSQVPPSSLDDFPALPPRSQQQGGHLEDRTGIFAGIGGLGGPQGHQSRQGSLVGSLGLGDATMGGRQQPSRLLPQLESMMQQPLSLAQMADVEKKNMMKSGPSLVNNGAPGLSQSIPPSSLSHQLSAQPNSPGVGIQNQGAPPPGVQNQQKFPPNTNGTGFDDSQVNAGSTSGMSDLDRFGLGGLLSLIRGEGGDFSMLALGQDLTQLGLDLNQPDNAPLYPSFASPWPEDNAKPVEPEFQLPSCYTVHNVQALGSRVTNFSDETLFYIFYTMPRDIMQEVVAAELSSRNWRYHTGLKLWLTKDGNSDPRPFSENAEKGVYVFFDPNEWERVRKEYILDYNYLDHRPA